MRQTAIKGENQFTLRRLINALSSIPLTYEAYDGTVKPKSIFFDFGDMTPGKLASWRGSYDELAISFKSTGNEFTAQEFLAELQAAVGATFEGWKGGEYKMGYETPLWVANPGYSSNTVPIGVIDGPSYIIILTTYCEYL